MKDRPVGTRE